MDPRSQVRWPHLDQGEVRLKSNVLFLNEQDLMQRFVKAWHETVREIRTTRQGGKLYEGVAHFFLCGLLKVPSVRFLISLSIHFRIPGRSILVFSCLVVLRAPEHHPGRQDGASSAAARG